jgi:hypothetical protein
MSKERRGFDRFSKGDKKIQVEILGTRLPILVQDIGGGGASLLVPAGRAGSIGQAPLVFQVDGLKSFSTRVTPVRVTREGAGPAAVGVKFEPMEPEGMRTLSSYLVSRVVERNLRMWWNEEEGIVHSDREQVRKLLLAYTVSQERRLWVYQNKLRLPLELKVIRSSNEQGRDLVEARVEKGEAEILVPGQEHVFAFPGANAINSFRSVLRQTKGDVVWFDVPKELRQSGFRETLRRKLYPDQKIPVILEYPGFPSAKFEKTILDVSGRGFSIPFDPSIEFLFPGQHLEKVEVVLPEGIVEVKARVAGAENRIGDGGFVCGLNIDGFGSKEGLTLWNRFVFHAIHPRLRLGEKEMVGEAWNILDSSGYLEETTDQLRATLETKYRSSWNRHAENHQVACYCIGYDEEKPIGTMAGNLLYPDVWMIHQFGIDAKARRGNMEGFFSVAREIYAGMMYVLEHIAACHYFIIYVDASKPWNEVVYERFLDKYPHRQEYLYDGYRVYKCDPSKRVEIMGDTKSNIRVVEGDRDLHHLLSRHQREHLPEIEFDAFCYDESKISLERFSRECSDHGFKVSRKIFFALEGDRPVAAMIAETGDEGINIFSLYNKCWFVPLQPEAGQDEKIKERLLRETTKFYQEVGVREFIYLGKLSNEPEPLLRDLGFLSVANGQRWLASCTMLPRYLSYVDELMRVVQ